MLDLLLKLIDRLIDLAKRREEVNREMFVDFVQPAFETFEVVHADYIESMTRYSARLADKTFKMDPDHPVFGDIEIDSLKSEHLRTKLADFKPANAPSKLKPFLTAISFYLRGVSASGTGAEFCDEIASPRRVRSDEKCRSGGQEPQEAYYAGDPQEGGPHPFMLADPLRETLRVALLGFDEPRDHDGSWTAIAEIINNPTVDYSYVIMPDDERRRLCAVAVKEAMQDFQNSYRIVSSTYSALRSELISPT
jgi:hypothetical protein